MRHNREIQARRASEWVRFPRQSLSKPDDLRRVLVLNPLVFAIFAMLATFGEGVLLGQAPAAPTPVPPGVSGYTVSYSNQATVSPNGYRTFWVTIETNPKKTVVEDKLFTVVIKDRMYNSPGKIASAQMTIEAGKSSATVELYPARPQHYSNLELLVERGQGNGRYDRGRDVFYTNVSTGVFRNNTVQPNLLLISSQVVGRTAMSHVCYKNKILAGTAEQVAVGSKVPALAGLLDVYQNGATTTPFIGGLPAMGSSQISYCQLEDVPNAWIGMTTFDLVMISFADLKKVCQANEVKRATLQKWVAAGGALIVFNSGPDYKEANSILPTLVGMTRMRELSKRGPLKQEWRETTELLESNGLLIAMSKAGYRNGFYYDESNSVELEETELTAENAFTIRNDDDFDPSVSFYIGRHVNGHVVCVDDDMAKWDKQAWISLMNGINLDGTLLQAKIGVGNPESGLQRFAIPGVGEPPVIAFQVLMSLFVIVAGPIMYVVLRRSKQLQLLFILVPTMSLTACLGLIGYAIFVDGFDSWGIVQSVSFVDQKTESAVTHARAAYYCGTQPKPYQFSSDTVPVAPVYAHSNAERTRKSDSRFELSGGNIKARTPHQIVSIRSHDTDKRLLILPPLKQRNTGDEPADGDSDSAESVRSTDSPTHSMRNLLGGHIKFAVALTDDGMILIEDLAVGEHKNCRKVLASEMDGLFRGFVIEFAKFKSENRIRYSGNNNREGSYWGEENRVVQLINSSQASSLLKEKKTYVAILEGFPETAEQIEKVNYKKQLHIVVGKW